LNLSPYIQPAGLGKIMITSLCISCRTWENSDLSTEGICRKYEEILCEKYEEICGRDVEIS